VLLTGGADVDPALYADAPHPTTRIDKERDAFEIPLSREALARDTPLFAICRGIQVLNVAAGGTLIQDIPSTVSSSVDHAVANVPDTTAHPIAVTPGTRLAAALDRTLNVATCPVNSRHHQSVRSVAPSFVVSATSPDGVIEAIERPDRAFCVGVQWHPENFWRTGEFAQLFEAFVNASQRRGRRSQR
jgi:putative glutamine amidotransferase